MEYERKKEKEAECFGCQTAHGELCKPGYLGTSVMGCLLAAAGAPLMKSLYGKKKRQSTFCKGWHFLLNYLHFLCNSCNSFMWLFLMIPHLTSTWSIRIVYQWLPLNSQCFRVMTPTSPESSQFYPNNPRCLYLLVPITIQNIKIGHWIWRADYVSGFPISL